MPGLLGVQIGRKTFRDCFANLELVEVLKVREAFDQQDPLGLMVVGIDDAAGKAEADLIKARR